jgi:hypothetical protein
MLGVLGDLKGVAGVIRRQIGNEEQRLSAALLLIMKCDVIDARLWYLTLLLPISNRLQPRYGV